MKKILLIDGFGYIFKSYYAFINRPLTNKDGENTSAIFGFFKSILSILNKENPDYFLVALESEKKCFRNDIYPEYKANRPPAPEDLKKQILKIIELLKTLEIPVVSIDGYEADDVIGTLSKRFINEKEHNVVIFSSDKDLRQLVNERVYITYTDKSTNDIVTLDSKGILEKMGVKPEQVIDYLALTGDSSDNIPGVKGIGPKTAVQLLSEFENLGKIYGNLEKISSKNIREKLVENKDKAFLSQKLATIKIDIPVEIDWDKFKIKPLNIKNSKNLLLKDNLNTIIDSVNDYNNSFIDILNDFKTMETDDLFNKNKKPEEPINKNIKEISKDYLFISSISEIEKKLSKIKSSGHFCFDIETTGFDFLQDKIISISISLKNDTFIIPFNISKSQASEVKIEIQKNYIDMLISKLKPVFEDEKIIKIGHNLKFDIKFLKTIGIETNGKLFDTMIAEYCLDGANNIYSMDDLALKYLGYKTIHYEDVVKNTKLQTLQDVTLKELVQYSGEDADITYQLYEIYLDKLNKNEKIKNLFYEIEMPLLEILIDMEYTGVSINKEYLKELSNQLKKEIYEITEKLNNLAEFEFNPNSPKQIAELLFVKLKLPIIKKTKTGPSTDVEVLKKLSYVHPIASLLLDYRTINKIKSTYSDALPEMINPVSNKIHTTYLQAGTQTGRLASKNPNLQNIPVKTEIGKKIRTAFIPSKNNILISADYAQIELFLLAELSKDPNLCDAFLKNEDIHVKTASLIFNKPIEKISKEERVIGKTINFSILYGQGAFRLSENLEISRKEALDFINIYFSKYPLVSKYMEEIKEKSRKLGIAETLWGRIRSIPEILENNKTIRANGERMAVNTTIQGTAADLIKISMLKIHERFKKEKIKSKIILQVHDELIFDAVKEEKDKVVEIVKDCMENGFNFTLKLSTSIKTGDNWGEF